MILYTVVGNYVYQQSKKSLDLLLVAFLKKSLNGSEKSLILPTLITIIYDTLLFSNGETW